MGKGGGGAPSNPSADELARISKELFSQTNPIRQELVNRSAGFLGIPGNQSAAPTPSPISPALQDEINLLTRQLGNTDPRIFSDRTDSYQRNPEYRKLEARLNTLKAQAAQPVQAAPSVPTAPSSEASVPRLDVTQSPMFGTLKNAIESQYGRARQNVISSTPAGGGLVDALADLERGKADALTSGIGGLAQDELGRAFSLATGGAQMGTSGLSNAASIQAQIAAAEADRQSAAKGGLGTALGYGVGTLFGGPVGGAMVGSSVGRK